MSLGPHGRRLRHVALGLQGKRSHRCCLRSLPFGRRRPAGDPAAECVAQTAKTRIRPIAAIPQPRRGPGIAGRNLYMDTYSK